MLPLRTVHSNNITEDNYNGWTHGSVNSSVSINISRLRGAERGTTDLQRGRFLIVIIDVFIDIKVNVFV